MKLIISPTDFSDCAANASMYAAGLASAVKAHLLLVHVYDAPVVFSEAALTAVKEARKQLEETARRKLDAMKKKIQRNYPELSVEIKTLAGLPNDRVITLARKMAADLIVMGVTGTNKFRRMLTGSTTTKVIRESHCPVFCIPAESRYKGIQKMVFATDLHEDNINSAMMIAPLAKKLSSEIIFLFVDDKHLLHSDEKVKEMTLKIRKRVKYPKLSGYISKNPSITKGIEYFLKKNPADILVMFTHEKTFTAALFNSSITILMSYQTKIPLLAIRHEDRPVMTGL